MKELLFIFGTRPEAIKMCPLIRELKSRGLFSVRVCVTAQHRCMLDGVLRDFGIVPDFDLDLMRPNQTLSELTARILSSLAPLLKSRPAAVLVHGDTTTAFVASLACFYEKIPICHVEAGLRTHDLSAPFPEEFNRRAIALTANLHFAPTEAARRNLLSEGIADENIFVCGNTAIDALKFTVKKDFAHPILDAALNRRILLITCHRRENIGKPLRNIFHAVRNITDQRSDLFAVCPMHPNPAVRAIIKEELSGCNSVLLTEPLDVTACHNIMARSYLILTDSGGIQEEAPALNIPVLVARSSTERSEGIESGALRLASTDSEKIYSEVCRLLDDEEAYAQMSNAKNPYGDGNASKRIAEALEAIIA